MSHFTSEFVEFFKELAANNNKDWFDRNRKRYETVVKQPFHDFVQEFIDRVRADDPTVDITPPDAIMRINRDIRFSKDKTPYNTYVAAVVSPGGRKDKTIPGCFIRLDAEKVHFYGGSHAPETQQLYRIRKAIARDLDGFSRLISDPAFKSRFGSLQGDKHKRLPPELRDAAEKQPLLFNKEFYYFARLSAKHITSPDFIDTLMQYYHAGKPLNLFLRRAIAG